MLSSCRDPLQAHTGESYAYANDNPLNLTDPSGVCSGFDPVCWAGGAANWAATSVLQAISDPVYAPASTENAACLEKQVSDEYAGWFNEVAGAGLYNAPGATLGTTLPPRNVLKQDGVTFEHYYPADHGPAHLHVSGPGGDNPTRIGPKGFPLAGDPAVSARQEAVYAENAGLLRSTMNAIGRALRALETE